MTFKVILLFSNSANQMVPFGTPYTHLAPTDSFVPTDDMNNFLQSKQLNQDEIFQNVSSKMNITEKYPD